MTVFYFGFLDKCPFECILPSANCCMLHFDAFHRIAFVYMHFQINNPYPPTPFKKEASSRPFPNRLPSAIFNVLGMPGCSSDFRSRKAFVTRRDDGHDAMSVRTLRPSPPSDNRCRGFMVT
ncbi:hypothetical protein AVEN_159078-1 [Araneus ventricosus]|uniref:Uncharacterized protein n=1 Tax=Araneus ventricosus TaxID=182803 RepID=A0A4Y2B8F9_ARAVE|nr:hypothetical protein AVEN_159078-1 [Araneus ventricosus]